MGVSANTVCWSPCKPEHCSCGYWDGFPQPQPRTGSDPCGECRLRPGETCDICDAVGASEP